MFSLSCSLFMYHCHTYFTNYMLIKRLSPFQFIEYEFRVIRKESPHGLNNCPSGLSLKWKLNYGLFASLHLSLTGNGQTLLYLTSFTHFKQSTNQPACHSAGENHISRVQLVSVEYEIHIYHQSFYYYYFKRIIHVYLCI